MTQHQYLESEFSFIDIANVPAIRDYGGMTLVQKKDSIVIDEVATNREESGTMTLFYALT